MSTSQTQTNTKPPIQMPQGNRWFYLVLAVLVMCLVSGVQYSWTLYAAPLTGKLSASLAAVQVAFTLSQLIQAVSQPSGGFFVDRFGPRPVLFVGAIMISAPWIAMGYAESIPMLYVLYTLSGAGLGVCYGIAINTANRWFPDKRGLASGFTAAGYGLGVLPFLPLITSVLKVKGLEGAFTYTGAIMCIGLIIISFLIHFPGEAAGGKPPKPVPTEKDFKSSEMLKTPHFYLLWFSFFSMNFGFLFLVANSAPFGRSMGIVGTTIAICVMMQNLFNGGCRPFWGWVSDKIGRYKTMSIMFGINAVAMYAFSSVAGMGVVSFIIMLSISFFTAGGSYALFPPTASDLFGTAFSAQNYGFFWAAKAFASIFGGGIGAAVATNWGWGTAFAISGVMSTIAFIIVTFIVPRLGRPKKKGQKEIQVSVTAA